MADKLHVLFGIIFIVQIINSHADETTKGWQACMSKILRELETNKLINWEKCFDSEKLKDANKDLEYAVEIIKDDLPNECRVLKVDNAQKCFRKILDLLKDRRHDISERILESISKLSDGLSEGLSNKCLQHINNVSQKIVAYMLNGCQGSLQ